MYDSNLHTISNPRALFFIISILRGNCHQLRTKGMNDMYDFTSMHTLIIAGGTYILQFYASRAKFNTCGI